MSFFLLLVCTYYVTTLPFYHVTMLSPYHHTTLLHSTSGSVHDSLGCLVFTALLFTIFYYELS